VIAALLLADAGDVPIEVGVGVIAALMLGGFGWVCWWFWRSAQRDRHLGDDVYVDPDHDRDR
jgi:hypothetical protein